MQLVPSPLQSEVRAAECRAPAFTERFETLKQGRVDACAEEPVAPRFTRFLGQYIPTTDTHSFYESPAHAGLNSQLSLQSNSQTGLAANPAPEARQQTLTDSQMDWDEPYVPASAQRHAPLEPGYTAMTPLPLDGLAMYYNPGVMSRVVAYRERMGEIENCDECVGFAALLRAGDLNRKIWIEWDDGTVEGPFLVADVAARHHVDMLIRRGWAVDVDNATAVRQGMFMPVAVTVHAAQPE